MWTIGGASLVSFFNFETAIGFLAVKHCQQIIFIQDLYWCSFSEFLQENFILTVKHPLLT